MTTEALRLPGRASSSSPAAGDVTKRRVVIVGGVAGGATFAARLLRLWPPSSLDVTVIERGADISFASCGLPYFIGREIPRRQDLVLATVEDPGVSLRSVHFLTSTEVVAVDRTNKAVKVIAHGDCKSIPYDVLLLSPGSTPRWPAFLGSGKRDSNGRLLPLPPNVVTFRSLQDMDAFEQVLQRPTVRRVAIIGAGFIGLEVAEQICRRPGPKKEVVLIEAAAQVLPQLDAELGAILSREVAHQHGVTLQLSTTITKVDLLNPPAAGEGGGDGDGREKGVRGMGGCMASSSSSFMRLSLVRRSGGSATAKTVDVDAILLCIGVVPATDFLKKEDTGLAMGPRGHILVDRHLRTSDANIYGVGDAVECCDAVFSEFTTTSAALGNVANLQARVAADHVFATYGPPRVPPFEPTTAYEGSLGTAIVRVFSKTAALTGWTEARLKQQGVPYGVCTVTAMQHASYFPHATPIHLKLTHDPRTGRIFGAQVIGQDGVDKRVDVLATAIVGRLTIDQLATLQLAYAPPFGAPRDVVNVAAFAALNVRSGLLSVAPFIPDDAVVLDVRTKELSQKHPLIGLRQSTQVHLMPLAELPSRLASLDRSRRYVTVCPWGRTAYMAARLMTMAGFERVQSLVGGSVVSLSGMVNAKL